MSRDGANGHAADRALMRAPTSAPSAARTENTDAIRAEIARTRTEVLAAMDDLHDQWGEVTTWRGLVARRPWTFVMSAAALGVLAALMIRPRRSQRLSNGHDD